MVCSVTAVYGYTGPMSNCLYKHVEVKSKLSYVNLYFMPPNKKYHFFKLAYNQFYYYSCLIEPVYN